jgi:type I restriction enzyme S subunit
VTTWAIDYCRFPQVPFRRLFEPLSRPVPTYAEIVTAYTNGQVTLRSNRRLDGYHEAADLSGFQGVRAGDFVVHGLDILRGSVGVSDSDGAISAVCTVCAPRWDMDPRFFAYAMRAQAYSGFPRAMARGIREGGADFRRWDTLAELPLPLPSDTQLSVIADYLDAETARIDALMSGLNGLLALVLERHTSFRDRMVDADAGGSTRRLSSVLSTRITDGPHETPAFIDEGVPFLSVDNMVDDGISFDGCRRISEAAHSVYARKSLPRRGDVLVTKAAAVGRVALVETDQVFNVWSPLAILRPDPAVVLPAYLHAALLGGAAQSRMKLASTSNTQENLSMRDLAALRIAVPSLRRQAEVTAQVTRSAEAARATSSALSRQIDLLLERRQALITAAVTGQLEIPGVAA